MMARTISIKFRSAELQWNTAAAHVVKYDEDIVKEIWKRYISNLKVKYIFEVRSAAAKILEDCMKENSIFKFMNLVMALRLTEIDSNERDEDDNCKVYLRKSYGKDAEITFENIRFHLNRRHKLEKILFVGYHGVGGYNKSLSLIGEAYDRDRFLDTKLEKDKWR